MVTAVTATLCQRKIQAECLGLFVEAVPRETSESLVSSVLQALAQLCKGSESTAPPPWQVPWEVAGKIKEKWWIFQQAMFDYRRVWQFKWKKRKQW
jgi:hypothetical protein